MILHRIVLAIGATACVLGAAGCGNSQQAANPIVPPTSSSPSISESPTGPPPEAPILGYTPKNPDERQILEQYQRSNEIDIKAQNKSLREKHFMYREVLDKSIRGLVVVKSQERDKHLNKTGIRSSNVRQLSVQGKKANLLDCADESTVLTTSVKSPDNPPKAGAKQNPYQVFFVKNDDGIWRISNLESNKEACK